MVATSHDRLLTTLAVHLHSASVCSIGLGWRLAFAPLETTTVHHVLAGSGIVQVGNATPLPYAPGSIIVVPPRQGHIVGDDQPGVQEVDAEEHCSAFADGLAAFSVGQGASTLLLCGSIPAMHGRALGLLDLLLETVVDAPVDEVGRGLFNLMRAEVAAPGLGTAAITEALMKACLVALLRGRLRLGEQGVLPAALAGDPRLARAALAVLENPGGPHSVASLADSAGMSRSSFADHFAQALGSGPMEFVQSVRLHVAARLLEATDLSLKAVAAAVGYADSSSLSRAFRGAHGTGPASYRSSKSRTWSAPPSSHSGDDPPDGTGLQTGGLAPDASG